MFLHTLGHGVGNRSLQEWFQHSGEIVSRCFSQVLDVVCLMTKNIIKPLDPEFTNVPAKILEDPWHMPHFKVIISTLIAIYILIYR